MKCLCGSKTKIIDTREAGKRVVVSKDYDHTGYKIRRRHECKKCNTRFSTIEIVCEIITPEIPTEQKPKRKKKNTNEDWLERINRKLEGKE